MTISPRRGNYKELNQYDDLQQIAEELRRISDIIGMISFGTGSPENVVAAPIGSLYLRSDGSAGTTFYVKESGTAKTGWIGK